MGITTTPTHARADAPEERKGRPSHFRPDVQGLRAVAIGTVLLFHAGAPFLPGGYIGVDVFFVISGFLITGLLLREGLTSGRVRLGDFYARRVRRILPAATVVLTVTSIATVLILPLTRWQNIANEIIGSAFYYVNWVFAAGTDYLNADVPASPLQHFWTLAVEEQFYIVWPLLLLVLLFFARPKSPGGGRSRNRMDSHRIRRYVEIGVLVLTVPSLLWSVFYTATSPAPAYFVTTTRLWELGIGACVAVFAVYLERIPARTGVIVGWAGLVAILAGALLFTAATPFPGVAALLPTLGAAGVIIGGMSGRAEIGAGRLLSTRPMRWVGDISYSLYLWHWPMIIIGTYLVGGTLQFWQGIIIILLAFVPSALSYYYVERPFQKWEYVQENISRTLQAGLSLMLISAIAGMGILLIPQPVTGVGVAQSVNVDTSSDSGEASATPVVEGAALLATDPSAGTPVDKVDSYHPSATAASRDNPPNYKQGCHQEAAETAFEACVYGDANSDFSVALVGDSHAAQWLPALIPIAKANGWRLESYTKSSCPLIDVPVVLQDRSYDECTSWNQKAMTALTGPNHPDHVILSSSSYKTTSSSTSFSDGLSASWRKLKDAGVPITVLLDTPYPGVDIPECVSVNPETLTKCAVPKEKALNSSSAAAQREAAAAAGVTPVDLTDMICPASTCAPVIGGVLVYRDTNHLTATYSTSLSQSLQAALKPDTSLRIQ